MSFLSDDSPICALATPVGRSALAILRISGIGSLEKCRSMLRFLPTEVKSHSCYVGFVQGADGIAIDEVVVTYFGHGKSFTGEETLEITCHGNELIVEKIIGCLIDVGCRIASPGEFSFRAFINGRIDLVQAESILNLINSQSEAARKISLRQLRGELSKVIHKVKRDVTRILAHIEASIDFSSEGLEVLSSVQLATLCEPLMEQVEKLADSYRQGQRTYEGLQVGIVGRPNVGKSSLLNLLVGEEKAIVSDIAGTTRDLIEANKYIGGVQFKFIDTAGLRMTDDKLEAIGISKANLVLDESDLLIYICDVTCYDWAQDVATIRNLPPQSTLIVANKTDVRAPDSFLMALQEITSNFKVVNMSCVRGDGVSNLQDWLKSALRADHAQEMPSVLINSRHFNLCSDLHKFLEIAYEELTMGKSEEFSSLPLYQALRACDDLLGVRVDEAVIDQVFKEFCLGK